MRKMRKTMFLMAICLPMYFLTSCSNDDDNNEKTEEVLKIIGKWISVNDWRDQVAGIPDYAYIFYENGRGKYMDKGNYYPNYDYDFTWIFDSATGLLTMIDDEAYPGQIREHTATIRNLTKNSFMLEKVDDIYFEKTEKPIYTSQGYEFK